MFSIEKNIPIPLKQTRGSKYPFADMEVGDSFFIPELSLGSVSGNVSKNARALGIKMETRPVREKDPDTGKEVDGVRVWRTQ